MQLHTINTGNFKLDGGAMFGVVPKSIWHKLNPADDNNLCTWAMRCLLIEDGNQLILIDTGIGNKQDDKFFSHYHLHGNDTLQNSLKQLGFSTDDITDVILTHLHFDHCGGAIIRQGEKLVPQFKNAHYWSNSEHWQWATQPNPREKASFLSDNILPIQQSGQLQLQNTNTTTAQCHSGIQFTYVSGHTQSMMLPQINYKGQPIIFCADLLPAAAHLPIPYVMAYDTQPLLSLTEKQQFLHQAAAQNAILFFEHDPQHECCSLQITDKGIRPNQYFTLAEL
jgi:glyoxylase-like metal-dependent hydrolase (beta-lactamase superfamily II)